MSRAVKIESTDPIVLVDDSDDDALIARTCYEEAKLANPFVVLRGGRELLAHLDGVAAGTVPMPALVLLDINMPEMDGFEVLAAIRRRAEFTRVPIIMMLTNSDDPRDVARSAALGADGFQVKPFLLADYVAFFASLRA
jgi:CheY-like chemotaxis protein